MGVRAIIDRTGTVFYNGFALAHFSKVVAGFSGLTTIRTSRIVIIVLLYRFGCKFATFGVITNSSADIIGLIRCTVCHDRAGFFARVSRAFMWVFHASIVIIQLLGGFRSFWAEGHCFRTDFL